MNIFGVIDSDCGHIDVSKSEQGAKCYATINGYDTVSVRLYPHHYIDILSRKVGGKWVKDTG
jgi:hypothetical protein